MPFTSTTLGERAQQQQHESSKSPDPGGVGAGMGVGVEFGKDIVLRKDRDLSMALDELECNLRRRTSGMEVVTGGGFGCQDSAFDGAEKAGQTETPEKSKRNEESEAVVISGAAGASTVSDSPARMFADQCMKPSTSDQFTGEAKRRLEFMLLEAETYMQIAHQHHGDGRPRDQRRVSEGAAARAREQAGSMRHCPRSDRAARAC